MGIAIDERLWQAVKSAYAITDMASAIMPARGPMRNGIPAFRFMAAICIPPSIKMVVDRGRLRGDAYIALIYMPAATRPHA